MKKTILIADSGGTSTEWCFIDKEGERRFFSGNSYHPLHWGGKFVAVEQEFWQRNKKFLADELYFFGAGCLPEENAKKMKLMLQQFGFTSASVKSDLHGAGLALYGKKSGAIAILGTGSVSAYFEREEIHQIKGGLGYLLGDEGSAFSFGKLLLKFHLEERLSPELSEQIVGRLGSRSDIIAQVYGERGRNYVADLAKRFADVKSDELEFIHELNISNFINSIENLKELKKGIAFCGSYAFHQRQLIKELLIGKQIPLLNVVQNPIEAISDYFAKSID